MKSLTIAQRREAQLNAFNERYIHDEDKARRLFNSYYRLLALDRRVGEMDNDEELYNSRYHKAQTAKRDKWYDRLKKELSAYNISFFQPWSLLYLGIKDTETGGIKEIVIEPILYY